MGAVPLSDFADRDTACIHASCVAVNGKGLLIAGPSGSGKSSLALQLMAFGAQLVADDRVDLGVPDGLVTASAPTSIHGLIEARGIGLLRADAADSAPLAYVVDLEQTEEKRLPDLREIVLLRQTVPLLRAGGVPNLAAALMQLAKLGRVDPQWPSK